jgi:hypothetical protein
MRWYIGAAFLRQSLTKANVHRVQDELASYQALALAESRGPLDEAIRNERECVAEVAQVGLRVHPHQQQVVALGQRSCTFWGRCVEVSK